MNDRIHQVTARTIAALRADRKKTTMMTVLAAVLCIAIVRLMVNGGRPAGAFASLVQSSQVAFAPVKPAPSNKNAAALTRWLNQPPATLSRNLFATHLDYFPTDNTSASARAANTDFWSQLGKSIAQATDEETKRENLKESFRLQAGKMRLQSTMAGAQPRAILNGQLVSEGNVIENFRVTKIEARRVVLEREGLRFELGMR